MLPNLCWLKPLPCHPGHKMHLNWCWPNHSHANEDTKYISSCVDQFHSSKDSKSISWWIPSQARKDTKYISTFVDHTQSMPTWTQNISQPVKIKPLFKRDLTNCISTIFLPTPLRTQNAFQHVLTNPLLCQRGHKMHHNMCSPKPYHASEYNISTFVEQPISCKRKHKMHIKSLPSQQGHKKRPNYFWLNPSHVNVDTKCISTCVDQTSSMPARKKNGSPLLLTKPLLFQRGHKMQHYLCRPNPSHAREDKMYLNMCWTNLSHASEDTCAY